MPLTKVKIKDILKKQPNIYFSAKDIKSKLENQIGIKVIEGFLEKLLVEGYAIKSGDSYKIKQAKKRVESKKTNDKLTVVEGRVDLTKSGAAFVVVDGLDRDIYISNHKLNGALHKDIVRIEYIDKRGTRRPEGKVRKILKRHTSTFVGVFRIIDQNARVEVNISDRFFDIYIKNPKIKYEDGCKVIVKLDRVSSNGMLFGLIQSKVSFKSESDYTMKAMLINAGFAISFDPMIEKEVNSMVFSISEYDLESRIDMRGVTTVTIDPIDAKDFDDALSLQKLQNGNWEVGVHIADVSHYVLSNTALDKAAFEMGNTVYLVDRVCPMLPEHLSNGICSLRPNEDKFCFSVIIEIDENLKLRSHKLAKSIICSDRRFAYEEVQEVLENQRDELTFELKLLDKIAKSFRKDRFENGAINFETDEVQVVLDKNQRPIAIKPRERKDAHLLVEEFMLLANRLVATYLSELNKQGKNIPFIYRIHGKPNMDRLGTLAIFAENLGLDFKIDTEEQIIASYNKLAEYSKIDSGFKILESIAIKTMAKAEYNILNEGHFGLGFNHYTHFTSPIRRYADLVVHRILDRTLQGFASYGGVQLAEICKHISMQERKAIELERISLKYKQVEYIQSQVGKEFEGVVSGIIERGIFVELSETKVEGLISFDKFGESFDLNGPYTAVGQQSKTIFRMGTKVKVFLKEVNLDAKLVDFEFIRIL